MPLKSHRKSSGSIVYLWLPVIVWDLSTLRTANVNTLPSPAQHAPLMCLRHMALYDKGVLIDWLIENVTVGIMWIYVFGLTKPKKNGFYRVTLCVSPVFAVARCPSVRPSVCLSVCHVRWIHMVEDIVKLLVQTGCPIMLVFDSQRSSQFQEEPLHRGRKIHRVWKFCDSPLKSPFDWDTIRDRSLVAMER